MREHVETDQEMNFSYIRSSNGNKSDLTLHKGDLTLLFPRPRS